ncbi:glutamate-rich protein 1 isoform X3 [Nannospalax galili]|uniref:Glutamate rich 1 n=1 Tax=Nannospalax galili TaxID=1026970 RepID=A0A8C6W4V8_NANGA|nr:glutamate-rich protein 1 isoform X3 [Nannospalax galili]
MSARRNHVFVEKVLKRLFPNVPSGQDTGTPQTLALETASKNVTSETVQEKHIHHLTNRDIKIQPECRLYTVSLPPEGFIPCLPEPPNCTNSDNASSGGDTEDLDLHDQPKRRRIRRRKSKKKVKNPNDVIEQAELEQQQSLSQEKLHPQHTDGPTMSRNRRRKLKKKLQLRRKKAAGFVTKACSGSFMYQPEESSSEQEDVGSAAGEAEDPQEEDTLTDTTQDITELAHSKADSILNFLKSTQDIYFYDSISTDSDSAVCMEATEELLHLLGSHSMPPSDVLVLDHMKTLLLLQDTKRLKSALKMFSEHCMMSPKHAKVILAFFNYWITHILPEKNSE